jgi:AraC-like DNA-binding protein
VLLFSLTSRLGYIAHYDATELARLCALSTRQLQRYFSRTLKRSPQEWLNEQRIEAARQNLLSGWPVKRVAFELGFKQVSHFCRQFKLYNQMTPSQFVSDNTARLVANGQQMSLPDNHHGLMFPSFSRQMGE